MEVGEGIHESFHKECGKPYLSALRKVIEGNMENADLLEVMDVLAPEVLPVARENRRGFGDAEIRRFVEFATGRHTASHDVVEMDTTRQPPRTITTAHTSVAEFPLLSAGE